MSLETWEFDLLDEHGLDNGRIDVENGLVPIPSTLIHSDEPSPDGWEAFKPIDLVRVLSGDPSRKLTGHYNYRRVLNIKKTLHMDVPNRLFPLDLSPSQFLEEFHTRKLEHYADMRIVIHNEEAGYVEIKPLTRGMPAYEAKVGDRFDDLRDYMIAKNLGCVFLTLSPRTPVGHSPLDSLLDMKMMENRLMSWLQVRLGFRPKVVWVTEHTGRGHAHYHFLFIGMNYLLPKEEIDAWFARQGLGDEHGVYIENVSDPVESAKKVISYLISYLVKPHSDKKWSGLLALTRKREWGMSNILRARINKWKEDQEGSVEDQSGLACLGLTNSNCLHEWSPIGILTLTEIEAMIRGKKPPPDELREDLRQIHGMVYAWERGKWKLDRRNN